MEILSKYDYYKFAQTLEQHYVLFSNFWALGIPLADERIATAAVTFNREGEFLNFLFNPDFWDSLNDYNRAFVICHEMLHVILNHGIRSSAEGVNSQIANVAMDIIVNETLVELFNFDRSLLDTRISVDGCWENKFLDEDYNGGFTFEAIYQHLLRNSVLIEVDLNGVFHPDDHSSYGQLPRREVLDKLGTQTDASVQRDANNKLAPKVEKVEDVDSFTYGTTAGTDNKVFQSIPAVLKRSWTSLFKKWYRLGVDESEFSHWVRHNRRLACIPTQDLVIPSTVEDQDWARSKINLFFFADTSGSCRAHANGFIAAAKTIPLRRFNIYFFGFETYVYKININKPNLQGFGGTAFDIIERAILQNCRDLDISYPHAVFVMTDGQGNSVKPKYPDRWYWFLTDRHSTKCIPRQSYQFLLSQFVEV